MRVNDPLRYRELDGIADQLGQYTVGRHPFFEQPLRRQLDVDAIERVLLRISELVCEIPEVQELDINPLIADAQGAIAIDARDTLAPQPPSLERHPVVADADQGKGVGSALMRALIETARKPTASFGSRRSAASELTCRPEKCAASPRRTGRRGGRNSVPDTGPRIISVEARGH